MLHYYGHEGGADAKKTWQPHPGIFYNVPFPGNVRGGTQDSHGEKRLWSPDALLRIYFLLGSCVNMMRESCIPASSWTLLCFFTASDKDNLQFACCQTWLKLWWCHEKDQLGVLLLPLSTYLSKYCVSLRNCRIVFHDYYNHISTLSPSADISRPVSFRHFTGNIIFRALFLPLPSLGSSTSFHSAGHVNTGCRDSAKSSGTGKKKKKTVTFWGREFSAFCANILNISAQRKIQKYYHTYWSTL